MSDDREQNALAIFREACDLPEEERAVHVDAACGQDAELRSQVQSMLAWDGAEDEDERENTEVGHPVRAVLAELASQARSQQDPIASIPTTIGGYRVVRLIAHGGMGDVYEAEQKNPARRVAIKVARVGGTTSERARRFELEAQLLARLNHPGIAQIIEAGTTPPEAGAQPFFVMELVGGESLTGYATAHLLTAREKLELMVRICEAVGFAHDSGVIHRDLKPDNVLIEAGGAPKVLDFGVAKVEAAGGFGAATLRTEAGRVLGTMGFMAPEQLGGQTEGLGPAADVYSLGVMIYKLLSGRLPHELDAATLTRALAVVTTTDAPLLGVIRPEFRGDIEAVVQKALEKDPRHRYPDAGALKADLERYLRGESIRARPAGPVLRLTRWTRRNPALATTVFGLFLALSTAAAILLVKNREVQAALEVKSRFLDAVNVRLARGNADALWPARPDLARAIRGWLDDARRLLDALPTYRADLDHLRETAGRLEGERWTFPDLTLQDEHDQLERLVQDLDAFAGDTALFEQMERRLSVAETIEETSVSSRKADWDRALARIRANAMYASSQHEPLRIAPQVGVIPLGPDPESGLEEFLHVETHAGDLPPPGDGERIELEFDGNTGLVFVLIPGGTLPPSTRSDVGPGRRRIGAIQGRRTEVSIAPFFLSKYEMTQGQWEHFHGAGQNPSDGTLSRDKPVNGVTWTECDECVGRLRLVLPTGHAWEYAARAGTATPWWTGPDVGSLQGRENVFDLTTHQQWPAAATNAHQTPADWFDERKQERFDREDFGPAPVGSYAPNPFGLYDVAGNVSEWCVDVVGGGRAEMDSVDDKSALRVARGGNCRAGTEAARSDAGMAGKPGLSFMQLGLRPAMAIHP